MALWKWFGGAPGGGRRETAGTGETETVRRITAELDRMEPDQARYIAAFAYVLGRAAHADLTITAEESRAMERLVVEHGGIPEGQAVIVVQIAKTRNLLFGATENFLVTKEFARLSSREQRLALLECLFAVSASEEGISMAEDNEIRRIASELGLEHRDFIAVRYRFREHLTVLRDRKDQIAGEAGEDK